MALSLNQIQSRIRSLALSHLQVNSFYFGDPHEFDINGEIVYPACFCELLPGSISRTDHQKRFNVRMYFLDLVGVSENTEANETEVLSDMDQVATDFISMLMYSEYEADWEIEPVGNVVPVTEALGDMAAGAYLEVGILVDFLADRCQVPANDVEFETDFDMARTRILTYTGTGLEGNSFTVTNLSDKTVLAVYRAGRYRRAITTTPTDSESIKVAGTDLGERKGILATGNVTLATGDALTSGQILDFLIYE
jgi:hypothetical protein